MKTNKKHPINLIGISGKMGCGWGKDTVGSILQWIATSKTGFGNGTYSNKECVEWLNGKYPGDTSIQEISGYQIKKFADKLKDIVCLLIGCTRADLEDHSFKEKELGEEWWYYDLYKEHFPYIKTKAENPDSWHERVKDRVVKLTPRKLLQLLGTECGRQIIHPNIWINALFADYKGIDNPLGKGHPEEWGRPNWIITDVRFPNELKAIKDRGGIVIRVDRANDQTGISSSHESEKALDKHDFKYHIQNDGSIEELVEKVKQIIQWNERI